MGHRQLELKVWLGLAPFYDTLGGFSRVLFDMINLQRIYSQKMTGNDKSTSISTLFLFLLFPLPTPWTEVVYP